MDRRTLTVTAVMMALFAGWVLTVNWIDKTHPEWKIRATTQPATQSAEPTTAEAEAPTTAPATGPATTQAAVQRPAPPADGAATLRVASAGPATQPTVLGSVARGAGFPMELVLSPRGAGIEQATLDVGQKTPDLYTFQKPYSGGKTGLNTAMAVRSAIIEGPGFKSQSVDLADVTWKTTTADGSVTCTAPITLKDAVVAEVQRTYTLRPKNAQGLPPDGAYEVKVTTRVVNRTDGELKVKLVLNGPTATLPENRNDAPSVVRGYKRSESIVEVQHDAILGLADKEDKALKHEKDLPLLWAGMANAYFNAIVRPVGAPAGDVALPIASLKAQQVKWTDKVEHQSATLAFETAEATVPAGQSAGLDVEMFIGPKRREILRNDYYGNAPLSYNKTLVMTSWPCSYCTFDWLINALVWLLGVFFLVLRDWGLAIIALVLLVRLILHPITKKSQIAMTGMQKMGPEVERLKKKYADNPQELQKAMAVFYKEQGIAPILGCAPMFLQMPIWIALWSALQSTFELRHAPFLWGFTWIDDLSQPDKLISFGKAVSIPLFCLGNLDLSGINILPIAMGVVFFAQTKLTPRPAALTKEQETQQKMMTWMTTLLFPLMLYSGPSGLNLYILTSSAIGIWESKVIRDHIRQREEAEKAGRVIVDARPTRVSKRLGKEKDGVEKPAGGISGWLAGLQAKAEEMRREADKKNRK